ncbi:DNA-binding transcriptional regulator, LysR family [Thermomonospora echinospora]|uniref:DNA-binding transcriptional regulator, LysR family n=1 Tax=Thermomonospora echinospora TaxID=1992 RepID=A0A1H5ZDW9_9ACTN|nr:LysR family transcriptional regulator [Thermomonospora echinospora]SEG34471.1 DNA-binding transcriptional regulator, LysR family [Thermomonospora echinospora]
MATLHQFRCFLTALEHGSFTAAAAALGYAQPSVSEQVRLLEQQLDTVLFRRAGRGLVPTEAAWALRPHAVAALKAADEAVRAVSSVRGMLTGTVRFGIFKTAHFYFGADLVADVLERHPQVRLELVGQNSAETLDQLRRGRLEAALAALPGDDEEMAVTAEMRDELVYVSADPGRVREPVTAAVLTAHPLVLPDVTWREEDTTRLLLAHIARSGGHVLRPRVEVEYLEAALEVAARGLADTVCWRGVMHRMEGRLPPGLHWAPLDPPQHERFALVHRPVAELSPATRMVIDLAAARVRQLNAALNPG